MTRVLFLSWIYGVVGGVSVHGPACGTVPHLPVGGGGLLNCNSKGQGLRPTPCLAPYLLGATSHCWFGLLHHVGMLCAAQPPRGGATLLAAAPATNAARYCAKVKPLGCALVSVCATACAYARWVPGRTGGIMPATNRGACGAAACAAFVPLAVCVVATVPAPVAAVAGGAVRLVVGAVVAVLVFVAVAMW